MSAQQLLLPGPVAMGSLAIKSDCGQYRYILQRAWGDEDRTVCFVMLNPSTADQHHDDATIRWCKDFAKREGFCRLRVVNLFAWISTDPAGLLKAADPIGPLNDAMIKSEFGSAELVICAWGTGGKAAELVPARAAKVLEMIRGAGKEPHCLRVTKDGFPGHPVRLSRKTKAVPFMPREIGVNT